MVMEIEEGEKNYIGPYYYFHKIEKTCCSDFEEWLIYSGLREGSYEEDIQKYEKDTEEDEKDMYFYFDVKVNETIEEVHYLELCWKNDNGWGENRINFCPFCGAKILLKETKRTIVRPILIKKVVDGYEEKETKKRFPKKVRLTEYDQESIQRLMDSTYPEKYY